MPIDEAKTINGAILETLGYIPEVDAEFTLGNYLISILSTKENAVETIKIKDMKGDYQLKVVS